MTSTPIVRRTGTALALGLLTLPLALPLSAQPDAVLRDFNPSSEYRLWVAGKEVPKAEIYESQVAGAYLILTSAFASPVLLGKRSSAVETVDLMKVAKQADGSVDLLADATLEPLGTARPENNYSELVFQVGGKEARLKLTPPLTGLHPRAALLAHSPEYGRGAAIYKPDNTALNKLRVQKDPARVKIYFGSWCSHCKQVLPGVLKVEESIVGARVSFEYYGLPRPPEAWTDAEVVKHGIKGVPTAVVYVGGKEVGRLTTDAWAKLEVSLADLLARAASAPR